MVTLGLRATCERISKGQLEHVTHATKGGHVPFLPKCTLENTVKNKATLIGK